MKLVGRNIAMQPTDMLALSIYFVGLAMVRPPPPRSTTPGLWQFILGTAQLDICVCCRFQVKVK